jgi:hypothetical protein
LISLRPQPAHPINQARFFAVSTGKLVVMSLMTLGLYEIYWLYKHWQLERDATGEDLSPFWRAVFGPLFAFSLFRRIRDAALQAGADTALPSTGLAVGYFILMSTWRLPDPLWLVSLLSFLPLMPIQAAVRRINAKVAPEAPLNDRFTLANVMIIVLGTLALFFAILGSIPQTPTTPSAPRSVAT